MLEDSKIFPEKLRATETASESFAKNIVLLMHCYLGTPSMNLHNPVACGLELSKKNNSYYLLSNHFILGQGPVSKHMVAHLITRTVSR